jgi:hypothetical protein
MKLNARIHYHHTSETVQEDVHQAILSAYTGRSRWRGTLRIVE